MPEEKQEVATLKTQVTKLESQVVSVTIESPEDYVIAVDLVSKLKDIGSRIKTTKESITKPLNESLKNIRSLFAPVEEKYEEAERIIKTKILAYKKKVDDEAKKEEAKIASRVEKGTLKLETAEKKIESIQRVDTTTKGKVGEIQVRKIKKVRITNEALIPREYLVPDMVAIRRDALGGKIINGIEVYEEE